MILMGLKDEADKTTTLICQNKDLFAVDADVVVFDTIIRVLGGLLSGYYLSGQKCLLKLALDLGHRLLPAFNSPTGIPYGTINLKTGKASVDQQTTCPACGASNILEFAALSHFTGSVYIVQRLRKMNIRKRV
jgi:mannosidase alpha-like ER degradation enhancer 2